ncbi:carboxymuconolactone decarboxylase family protein [Litoribacter ruber]|uniref:Carboxymuconolactone decarboxylase family protein n=1 Tax=Litoribacter ruber TaxID=702568 RepID=A0AAP2G5H0_9BACT|nr:MULTISPECIES: carboxymuconolactone decarboxylase family protein [Litoribacter]MBS9524528.1 carboxymuconolactone decarboxylase family protein [Litoribacter alkaliphilus]MBT0810312.1 carboxymuconolactone decarboxylase family protein [Litoribacter ruber]
MSSIQTFQIVEYKDASEEVKAIYDDTMATLGIPFVLNWFKCQGSNATLLRGNWGKLKSTLCEGTVPNIIKQLIIYSVSAERKCAYCAEAHKIFANMIGKSLYPNEDVLISDNLRSDIIPHSYKVAVSIVSNAAIHNGQINQEHFDILVNAGYNSNEIQELFAQADLVNMLNTIANISGIKVDNELVELSQSFA